LNQIGNAGNKSRSLSVIQQVLAWLGLGGLFATIAGLIALAFFPFVELTLYPVSLKFDNSRKEQWQVYFRELDGTPKRADGSFSDAIRPGAGVLNLGLYGNIDYAMGELTHRLDKETQTWILRGYWTADHLSLSYFNPKNNLGIGSYQMVKTSLPGGAANAVYWAGYTTSREDNTPDLVICPAVFMSASTDESYKLNILKHLDKPCEILPYRTGL
jgi:hypothetical protein